MGRIGSMIRAILKSLLELWRLPARIRAERAELRALRDRLRRELIDAGRLPRSTGKGGPVK